MSRASEKDHPPLKPQVLHILLALAQEDQHGLGIADQVAAASEGTVKLGPGTLYRSLDEMRESRFIQRVGPPSDVVDPRRKYYRITPDGRRLLQAEMARLQRLVDHAMAEHVLPEGT